MDYASSDDVQLTIDLIKEIIKPRISDLPSNTALGHQLQKKCSQAVKRHRCHIHV
jgi:hypothetical protein